MKEVLIRLAISLLIVLAISATAYLFVKCPVTFVCFVFFTIIFCMVSEARSDTGYRL